MQINRKQLRYIYNRFGFTRPSLAFYPENSATPGKCATYGEARVGIMTNGTAGIMVEPGAVNLLTDNQASVETGTTGFSTISAATFTRVTTEAWHGTASLRMQSSIKNDGVRLNNGIQAAGKYTFSVMAKGTGNIYLTIYDGTNLISSDVATLTNVWTRYSVTGDMLNAIVWGYVRQSGDGTVDCYLDGLQLAPIDTSWQLPSTPRAPETLSVPGLPTVEGEIEFTAEITDKCKRQAVGETPRLLTIMNAPGDYYGLVLHHASDGTTFGLQTRGDDGEVTSKWFADSLIPNGTRTLKISIATSAVILYCDGAEIARIDNPKLPSGWGRIYLGSSATGTNHADAMFGGIKMMATDSTVLSDILFNGPDFIRKARTIQL